MEETNLLRGGDFRPQLQRPRRNGWTEARRRMFFDHLRATCNVRASVRAAGMTPQSAHARRRSDPVFAALWREALEEGYMRLEAMLIARAGGTADNDELARLREAEAAGGPEVLDALTESLDTELALTLLQLHRRALGGGTRRPGGPVPKRATVEQVRDALLAQLSALNRRRGGAG